MRILAVDPGSKQLGVAISDPTGTIANPLTVLTHVSRPLDAASVAELALSYEVGLIVVGQSFDEDGNPSFQGRQSARFAEALKTQTSLPVILWDESLTTQDARSARIQMGASRKDRSGHLDQLAATVLLQSYLDANPSAKTSDTLESSVFMKKRRSSCLLWSVLFCSLLAIGLAAGIFFIPRIAWQTFGAPSPSLSHLAEDSATG